MFGHTIDSVVSDITRKVTILRGLSASHSKEACDALDLVEYHKQRAAHSQQESERAARLADKFSALVE